MSDRQRIFLCWRKVLNQTRDRRDRAWKQNQPAGRDGWLIKRQQVTEILSQYTLFFNAEHFPKKPSVTGYITHF